ncbi:MAG: efflux RND transporter periplasmic adaptor subunit [Symplocastrum torsivum CPER-KK1]|jgi:RND family efflux transporter MFP subunit|uniref:Efflux RND transporter periplasmic adaptor subunit n=1 Tax=Symplocastrum torsivum CPER-KK1 TaxID=450513 RepID=A0A951U7V0_9CYAN|nr:efflux RND transporter periplasmic adaptor subunit [Symplocastrum torsivum CPER-KK1]
MTNKSSEDIPADQLDETWDELDESLPPRRKRGKLTAWQGVAIGIGVGIALTAGAGTLLSRQPSTGKTENNTQQAAQPSSTVTVAQAQTSPIARTLATTGTVAARNLIPVLPQATGLQVKLILVEEGQAVKAGQVMAVLDDSVLRAQLAGGQANVASNQAVVKQRQAALQQARATLAEAQSNLQRYQTLARNGAISRQELETRATTAATAREAVASAEAQIGSAEADVRSSVATVQQLQTQLGQTVVRAPASGVVAEKTAQIGDVSNGTQKLFSIIGNGALELEALVPATQLPQVRIGAPATITSDTDNRVRLSGQVREIAPLVNAESREATVSIDIPQTNLLRPGMFARAAITTTTATGVTVPSKAVLPQPDGSSTVFLLSGEGKVQARKVEVGEVVNDGNVEIRSGLQPGDRVVVAGAGFLKDGDTVRVANQ